MKTQRNHVPLWLAVEPYLPQGAGAAFPEKVSGLRDPFSLPTSHRLTSPPSSSIPENEWLTDGPAVVGRALTGAPFVIRLGAEA